MSTQNPIHTGSDPQTAPPESYAEVLVVLEHRVGTPPAEMLNTVNTAADRIGRALAGVDLSDLPLSRYDLDLFTRLQPAGVPLFPLQVGDQVLTCQTDAVEAVERACHATDLGQYARDVAGRTFELHVDVRLTPASGERDPRN